MIPEVPAKFWFSLPIALTLELLALPDAMAAARPLIILPVLAYWILTAPGAPSLLAAFVIGLLLDVHYDTVLGQHAAALLVPLYFVAKLRAVIGVLPLMQAMVALAPAWASYCLLMSAMDAILHHRADTLFRWLPALTTIPAWALAYALFDHHSLSQGDH